MKKTEREKLLILVVVLLVVAFGGLFVFTKVQNAFETRENQITTLEDEILQRELRVRKATRAKKRLSDYEIRSLPADPVAAQAAYQDWILKTTGRFFGDTVYVKPSGERRRPDVFSQLGYDVNARGDLERLTQFLYHFYSMNTLHRIGSLSIKPIPDSRDLELNFKLEAMSLPRSHPGKDLDRAVAAARIAAMLTTSVGMHALIPIADVPADAPAASGVAALAAQLENKVYLQVLSSEPAPRLRAEHHELADYTDVILSRNLFGTANQPPQITSVDNKRATTNRTYSATVKASDPDPLDTVRFLPGDDFPEGAELHPTRGTLTWKPSTPGPQKFSVRVVDDGWPAKTTSESFIVMVEDPPAPTVEPVRPVEKPGPTFDAKHTVVTAILQGSDGEAEVWLHVRPRNRYVKLRVGESFDIGNVQGVVKEIRLKDVVIDIEGRSWQFVKGERITEGLPAGESTGADVSETNAPDPLR